MPFRTHRIFWLGVLRWSIRRPKRAPAEFIGATIHSFRGGFQTGMTATGRSRGRARPKHPFWLTLFLTCFAVAAAAEFSTLRPSLPVVFAVTLGLAILLRSRFTQGWYALRKLMRVAISVCLLYGFWTLLNWPPLWRIVGPFGFTRREAGFWLILSAILIWWVSVIWIAFSRPYRRQGARKSLSATTSPFDRGGPGDAGPGTSNDRNWKVTDRTFHRYLN
jgi:hypothetical protein